MILCAVTDRRRRPVADLCRAAVRAGVDFIQLRELDLEAAALLALAATLVQLTRGTSTRVLVNDRLDVALACGADGVHLRGTSIPPARAREMTASGFLIGQSVRSAEEALRAAPYVDYLIAGTVFPSASKPGLREHLGADGLAAIAASVAVPVLAIGGVSMDRIDAVAASGAAGFAAIGLFEASEDLGAIAGEARRRFDSVRSAS